MSNLLKSKIIELAKYWAELDAKENTKYTEDLREYFEEHFTMNDLYTKITPDLKYEYLQLFIKVFKNELIERTGVQDEE